MMNHGVQKPANASFHCTTNGGRERGFTLIEILVAIFILTMVSSILYASFRTTLDTQIRVKESQIRWHVLRVGVSRMVRELTQAYVSLNENLMATDRRTFFVAEKSFDIDEVTFSSFSHKRLVANAAESDQCLIRYYGAPDPEDRGKTNLMRRETRRIQNEPFEDIPGEAYILIEDVQSVHYHFYDRPNDQWLEEWNTTSMDGQPNRLPDRIRIYVTVLDEKGKELMLVTEARPAMMDAINLAPPQTTGGTTAPTSRGSSRTGGPRSSVRTSGTPSTNVRRGGVR